MRRDAQAGHAQSLLGALIAHEDWGLSDAEKLACLGAYVSLPGHPEAQPMAKALVDQGTIRFKTPPTPGQLEAAKPAMLKILERVQGARP
ncbi:MAG: hypothetical protein QM788_08400 [Roseateles sp.]|uniref:hypothetical protein n=1 Tax=Roseateles sp. TaxID=1971397 RepID=UPI0039EC9ED6